MSRIERGVYTPPLLREPGFGRIDPLGVDGYRDTPYEARRGGMLLMVSVAVLLALIGVIWSTYNQGVREGGRDAPPRIAALAEPFKVAPDDPGGETTDHLGIRVFDVLEQRMASAAVPTEAPEPLGLGEAEAAEPDVYAELDAEALHGDEAIADWEIVEPHDIHTGAAADTEPPSDSGQGGVLLAEASPPAADDFGPGHPLPRLKPLQRDPAEETAGVLQGPRTLADVSDEDRRYFARREVVTPSSPEGQAAPPAAANPSPATVAVPPSALEPSTTARSAISSTSSSDRQLAAAPTPVPTAPVAAAPAPTAPTPAVLAEAADGAFLVQVASFRSLDAAQQGWSEFHLEFDDLLQGYAPNVAEADLGDRGIHYRLRVGVFTNRAAASYFCDQVKARGRECLVVGS